jgi:hypothetical protein
VGVAALAQRWQQLMSAWENCRSEADEYRELDGERASVLMRHGGRGKTSGVEVEQLDTAGCAPGTFRGRDAVIGFLNDWISSFDDLTMEPDQILDVGNGVVLTVYHQEGPSHRTHQARAAAERLAQERADA